MRKNYLKTIVIATALMTATGVDAQVIAPVSSTPALRLTEDFPAENALEIKVQQFSSECITDFSKMQKNEATSDYPNLLNLYRNKIEIQNSTLNKRYVTEGSVIVLECTYRYNGYGSEDLHFPVAVIKFSNVTTDGCNYKVTYRQESEAEFEKPIPPEGHCNFDAQDNIDFNHLTLEDAFARLAREYFPHEYLYDLRFAQNPVEDETQFFNNFTDKTQLISNRVQISVFNPIPLMVQEDAKFSQMEVDSDIDHHLPAKEFVTVTAHINTINPEAEATLYDIYRISKPADTQHGIPSENNVSLKIGEIKHEIGSDNYTVSALDASGNMQFLFIKTKAEINQGINIEDKISKKQNLNLNYAIVAHIDNAKYKGSYGTAPKEAVHLGEIEAKMLTVQRSNYNWKKDNKKYCYYTAILDAFFKGNQGFISPSPALVRVWRECDLDVLGEELKARQSRLKSSYLFEEQYADAFCQFVEEHEEELATQYGEKHRWFLARLGANEATFSTIKDEEKKGTFGARMVDASSDFKQFTCHFRIRVYYTILLPSAPGIGEEPEIRDYYIAEYILPYTITEGITTGIDGVVENKAVKSVTFHNLAGMTSSVPFEGMNIVITTFSDGTTATQKVMK